MLPVVHGDVAFDEALGGTILSTEDVFAFLAEHLSPTRILLAGIEAGVWEDFPARTKLVKQIQLSDYEKMKRRHRRLGEYRCHGWDESQSGRNAWIDPKK